MVKNNYDFWVTVKRRTVWNCELELYEEFRKICLKHNLQYFAISGTLLGTIRHQGFIPWDDDIDVGMPRKDYEEFLKCAESELPEWIFLQTPFTDSDYYFGHAKLRKKNTTAIRKVLVQEPLKYHQGIFIDVFPMDNIPDDEKLHKRHRFISLKLMQMIYYVKYHYKALPHSKKEDIKSVICKTLMPTHRSVLRFYKAFERQVTKYDQIDCSRWGMLSVFYANESMFTWDKKDYKKIIELPFENTVMPVPANYDHVLRSSFGDYMVPVRGGSQHGEIFYDVNKNYSEYLNGIEQITDDGFDL